MIAFYGLFKKLNSWANDFIRYDKKYSCIKVIIMCYIGLFIDEFCMTGQLLRFNVFPIKSIQKC